jgi:threonine/homoserine/homoserine lactone efflux protein
MSGLRLFLEGLVIGFAIAAPVGPIGLLCIQRTLAHGRLMGLASGLGAATADMVYGCVAAFGLAFVTDALLPRQVWLRFVGAGFLVYLGLRTIVMKPADVAAPLTTRGLAGAYLSTFVLTLANPLTILSFAGIFTALGLSDAAASYRASAALVVGVFVGSALWWLALSGGVSLVRGRFDQRTLQWVNRVSGVAILAFAVLVVARNW